YDRLSNLLSTGISITLLLGAIVVTVLWTFNDEAVRFFNVDMAHVPDAQFVILGVGLVTALTLSMEIYPAVLVGIQRLDVKNYCRVGIMTIEFICTIVFLYLGFGIRALVIIYGGGLIVSTLIMAWFVYRYLPGLHINPLYARWSSLKELFKLGSAMQILGVVTLLVSQLDILLFMRDGGPAFVGAYGAAQRFAQRAQGAALQGFGALAPASADLHARDDYEKLSQVYGTAMRICAVACAFIFSYMAFFPDYIMIFVMGDKFEGLSASALVWLSAGFFVHSLTGPGTSMLRGAGQPAREIFYTLLTAVNFLLLYVFLGHRVSDEIMLATWPVALLVASAIFIMLANRHFRVAVFLPLKGSFPVLIAAPLLAWLVRFGFDWLEYPIIVHRWIALVIVLVSGVLYTALFAIAALSLPGLTDGDKMQLARVVPGGVRIAKRFNLFPHSETQA
ncbi:MAG: oligosaccharide flippase family protein, partial [Candidatus Hydrogenedentes bacterium]|nr:oligosaccharide flippase family protein [Candidatus Hydrogenedentota bacterium]